ncbi:MAG: hypothetical protein KC493_01855 [Bacteriovoracaceae bacterium]|nr:hypothetical protein [Bacteriovoracaceae bacterium]
MNKISLYVLLILIYLGLSKSFSPSEQRIPYIINEKVYANFFRGTPLSVMLIDSFQTGFLIKTYFQKYKVFHGFKSPEIVTVRTSPEFWNRNLKNLGLSLFRRYDGPNNTSTTPLPPGSLYIGNLAFGSWHYKNSGKKVWRFHRAYRHFPKIFAWREFNPSFEFFERMKIHIQHQQPFYGLENEFGEKGSVTSLTFNNSNDKTPEGRNKLSKHLKKFFHIPVWKRTN